MSKPIWTRRGLRILVVDDHDMSAEVLARLLKRGGHHVATAGSARGALAAAGAGPPFDLLLSDVRLPDLDGCELLRRLRLLSPGVHAIAITGDDGPGDVERCSLAGFSQALLKPIDFRELLASVQDQQARLRPTRGNSGRRHDPRLSTTRTPE
jgi:two-component system, chemotaxis family, CheB/CheR fusion protein